MTSNKDIIIFDEKDSENNCLSFRGHCEKIISIISDNNICTIVLSMKKSAKYKHDMFLLFYQRLVIQDDDDKMLLTDLIINCN